MDIVAKMDRFQILQNVLNVKYTLACPYLFSCAHTDQYLKIIIIPRRLFEIIHIILKILYSFFFIYRANSCNTMPGHVKKSTGPDPDPSPWLLVSDELKVKLKSKPYDPKKSCWVPDKATHGYFEGLIESADGDKVTVKLLESKEVYFS